MKIRTLITAAAASIPVFALAAVSPGQALVNKLTHNQLQVKKEFKVDGTNLTGFVVAPKKQPSQENIFYTDSKGTYLIAGNVISAKGKNLTQFYTNEYITKQKAVDAYKNIKSTDWISQGLNRAPHKVYVFFDPNCAYCHLLHQKLQPYIKSGELQVRWIPVAIRPNSKGKTARIMHAKTPTEAVKLLNKDEKNFDMRTEEGSLKPLKQNPKDKSVVAAFAKTKANTTFFIKHFVGTPVMLYKDDANQPAVIPGFIQGKQLKSAIDSMSNKW